MEVFMLSSTVRTLNNYAKRKFGVSLQSNRPHSNMGTNFLASYDQVKSLSMVNYAGLYMTYQAAKNVALNHIPGDIVECGVWRGGASYLVAETLRTYGVSDKNIYMFDTFSGMSKPTKLDVKSTGLDARSKYKTTFDGELNITDWCFSSLDEVKNNMKKSNYNYDQFIFVPGKVEETIPKTLPEEIALLRLDTDWYESTHHELVHLYPKVVPGGLIIVDDYTAWKGARKATDDYLSSLSKKPVLFQDSQYGGLLIIKTD